MRRKRRKFTADFKLKVVLESLKEREPLSQLAQRHELHPNQIGKWKTEFLDNAKTYMGKPPETKNEDTESKLQELYAKIGQLQVELDFLKKKLY